MAEKQTKQARIPLKQLERIQADPYHADQSIQWIADTALTRYADYVENGEGRRDAIVHRLDRIEGKIDMLLFLTWYARPIAAKLTAEDVQEFKAALQEVSAELLGA